MGSFEDARQLVNILHLLERAAGQASECNRILLPDPQSVEAITARTLIGAQNEEVKRHLIFSKLIQLAIKEDGELPSVSNEHAVEVPPHCFTLGDDTGISGVDIIDVNASLYHCGKANEADDDDESAHNEFQPLTPDSAKWQESQQWQSAF
ncbi:unnamed protein product [Cylindrotheca closterium]|uniref:Uncharacterized protein n=1 Tax=Cylindrotheca closterium TaxID=2856 RepID=A0AAD2FZF7_9STRA|nr:unnamed protein product [Cylindrotheca closterium]